MNTTKLELTTRNLLWYRAGVARAEAKIAKYESKLFTARLDLRRQEEQLKTAKEKQVFTQSELDE